MNFISRNSFGSLVSTSVEMVSFSALEPGKEHELREAVLHALELNMDGKTELASAAFEALALEMRQAGTLAYIVNSRIEEPTPGLCLAEIFDAIHTGLAHHNYQ